MGPCRLGRRPGRPVADAAPAARRDREHKAAAIAAYRETYGYDHPGDPIGPEPGHGTPDQRAARHEAFTTVNPATGPDVRGMADGRLWLLRDTYAAETAWAPSHTGKELRQARLAAFDVTSAPSAPLPKPMPPARAATTTAPPATSTQLPAIALCVTFTSGENILSPR